MLCAWIVHHLKLFDVGAPLIAVKTLKFAKYVFWLVVEIGKSDWNIAKVILANDINLQQRLIRVPVGEGSDFSKMLYANSITITPGTVTVETETDCFIVHALIDETADQAALADMGSRAFATQRGEN